MGRIFILFLLGLSVFLGFGTKSQADQQVSQEQLIQQQIAQQQLDQIRQKELQELDQQQLQQLSADHNQYLFDDEYDRASDAYYYGRRGLESRRAAYDYNERGGWR